MKKFLRAVRIFFAWREVYQEGPWSYQVNKITCQRRVIQINPRSCHQPFNQAFLDLRQPPTREARYVSLPPTAKSARKKDQ